VWGGSSKRDGIGQLEGDASSTIVSQKMIPEGQGDMSTHERIAGLSSV